MRARVRDVLERATSDTPVTLTLDAGDLLALLRAGRGFAEHVAKQQPVAARRLRDALDRVSRAATEAEGRA